MKSFLIAVITAVAAFLYFQTDLVHAQVPEKSCKAVMGDLTKRQLGGIATCTKSMKFKNGKDKSKKMNCILKCVLTNEKMLDEGGYFTKEKLDALLVREFPPSLIDRANKSFGPCADAATTIDPSPETDEFCKSYDPFIKCLFGNLPNLCAGT